MKKIGERERFCDYWANLNGLVRKVLWFSYARETAAMGAETIEREIKKGQ